MEVLLRGRSVHWIVNNVDVMMKHACQSIPNLNTRGKCISRKKLFLEQSEKKGN